MSATAVVPFAGRLFLAASVIALVACGGNAAGPEPPNPPGVADTIIFDLQTTDVEVGDTARLGFVARDVNGAVVPNVTVTWRSLNPGVATVSADGLVTTHGIGEAEIEVEATIPGASPALLVDGSQVGSTSLRRGVKSRAKIIVTPKVVLSPSSATSVVHNKTLFTATVTDANGQPLATRPSIRWTSSSPAVATIDVTGLATALTKGTTTITATVSAGSSSGMKRTATLSVTDECGGIAAIQKLTATLNYKYTAGGTLSGAARVASVYSGDFTAEMTNLGWDPGIPTVVWKGPLKGGATQIETVHDSKNKETQKLEGAGPVVNVDATGAHSDMTVIVELKDCTFRMETQVSIDLTSYSDGNKGPTLPMQSARLFAGAGKKLNLTGGNPFPSIDEAEFPGHATHWPVEHPTDDVFAPQGWAAALIREAPNGPVGKADVSFLIKIKP